MEGENVMSNNTNRPKPRLGIGGWVYAGKYGIERYAYILHRITGLGLLAYFILHIFVTSTRAKGESAWKGIMALLGKPLFLFGEYLVFIAFAFHALNGIRLILAELGYTLGKPGRPIYPYETSLKRGRPVFLGLMVISAFLIIIGSYDFFIRH